MCDKTMTFSVNDEKEIELKKNLTIIYDALVQKGYNPINQIVGYILSEDPTYITTYNKALSAILTEMSFFRCWLSLILANKTS